MSSRDDAGSAPLWLSSPSSSATETLHALAATDMNGLSSGVSGVLGLAGVPPSALTAATAAAAAVRPAPEAAAASFSATSCCGIVLSAGVPPLCRGCVLPGSCWWWPLPWPAFVAVCDSWLCAPTASAKPLHPSQPELLSEFTRAVLDVAPSYAAHGLPSQQPIETDA